LSARRWVHTHSRHVHIHMHVQHAHAHCTCDMCMCMCMCMCMRMRMRMRMLHVHVLAYMHMQHAYVRVHAGGGGLQLLRVRLVQPQVPPRVRRRDTGGGRAHAGGRRGRRRASGLHRRCSKAPGGGCRRARDHLAQVFCLGYRRLRRHGGTFGTVAHALQVRCICIDALMVECVFQRGGKVFR
jgi:hypothetical protein